VIKKVVRKYNLNDDQQRKDDLEYWLSKTPEERIEAVQILRRRYHGSRERLQRVVKIVQLLDI